MCLPALSCILYPLPLTFHKELQNFFEWLLLHLWYFWIITIIILSVYSIFTIVYSFHQNNRIWQRPGWRTGKLLKISSFMNVFDWFCLSYELNERFWNFQKNLFRTTLSIVALDNSKENQRKKDLIFSSLSEIQSNLYKIATLGTTQKWLFWVGGCHLKHLC